MNNLQKTNFTIKGIMQIHSLTIKNKQQPQTTQPGVEGYQKKTKTTQLLRSLAMSGFKKNHIKCNFFGTKQNRYILHLLFGKSQEFSG